jgi:hypothetical protein
MLHRDPVFSPVSRSFAEGLSGIRTDGPPALFRPDRRELGWMQDGISGVDSARLAQRYLSAVDWARSLVQGD